MKIALVSTPYVATPPIKDFAGIETVVADKAAALAELGHDVTLFAADGSKPIGDYEVIECIEPTTKTNKAIDVTASYAAERQLFLNAQSYFEDEHFDAINIDSPAGKIHVPVTSRIFQTVHDNDNEGGTGNYFPNVIYIAISDFRRRSLLQYFCSKGILNPNLELVYNGINLDKYSFYREKDERALFVSRIFFGKRPDVAIKAAINAGIGIDIIGSIYDDEYYKNLLKMSDGHDIKFYININNEEKIKFMQKARCLITPSCESFGLPPLEALACGTPVIARNVCAVPEFLDNGYSGFLYNDPSEIVEYLLLVRQLNNVTCRRNAERFGRQHMAKEYVNIYRKYGKV